MQLALDSVTHDLIIEDGIPVRVSEGRYTIQQVKCALLTNLGEYLPNSDVGYLKASDFDKNPNLLDLEIRAREVILGTKGVLVLDDINLELVGRKLYITFTAKTEYGGITDTIGWGSI